MPPKPSFSTLQAFAAAARTESLRDAAIELRVTPSAISHQVRALEDWIGAPVFVRTTRQVRLTPLGKALALRLLAGFDTIAGALDQAREASQETRLRISALPLFTNVWLIPRLGQFRDRLAEQGIEAAVDLDSSQALAALGPGGVDVAIRNVVQPGAELVAHKLLDLRAVPLCAPALAKDLAGPTDLARATLIHVSSRPDGWRHWLALAGYPGLQARSHLSVDTVPAALDAAAAGHGVALILDPLVWAMPQAERVCIPFRVDRYSAGAYFLVYRREDRMRRLVRAFADWLVQEVRADLPRLAGLSRKAWDRAG